MTRDVVRRGARFVIWPESSTPFTFEEDPVGERAMRDLAREVGVPILFGSDQAVLDRTFQRAADREALQRRLSAGARRDDVGGVSENSSGAVRRVRADGRLVTVFPPLVQTLAGFAPFSPGDSMVMLPVGMHRASTAICYEVVYPSLVREAVLGGSELLTTITNDAWYGHSSAPYQHFAMASMRAIEHGRYLARAANTGISGVIDPYGRVVAQSAIFEQVGLVEEARFLDRPYGLHGNRRRGGLSGDCAMVALALVSSGRRLPDRDRLADRTRRLHWPSTSTTSNDATTS